MVIMKNILSARPYVRSVVFGGTLLILGSLLSGISQAHAKYASFVIDVNTGKVLHQKNATTRNYPASLTKMMTLYMLFDALESGKVSKKTKITFSKRAASRPSTNLRVAPGYKINVDTAIKALVVRSANDVATAVAEHLGGTEAKFARAMTRKARRIGMKRSHFKNASGLPNRGQLSTAKDMAILSLALQEDFPQHYHYFSTKKFTYSGTTYKTHNRLLTRYNGTDGIKTGYTRASGFNIATSVKRDGHHLIGVVFGGKTGKSRDRHMQTLLNKSFAKLTPRAAAKSTIIKAPIPKKIITLEEIQQEKIARPIISNGDKQAYFAPILPKQNLHKTLILSSPNPVTLVQDFQTGNPKYDGGGWSVQVGAYYSLPQATAFFSKLLPKVNSKKVESVILSQTSKRGSIYKPRLVGMRKSQAYNMCKQLKTQKLDCLVISPASS